MKYRVIGWTYYENSEFIDSGNRIGFAERNAIIDEIRKHKYLFSGWHHQESWEGVVPILNDGRTRCFSQRGWGGVMAEAYEKMGDYDYARYTFNQSISSNKLKFAPETYSIDVSEIDAVENEHFDVEISKELFEIAKTSNPFYLEDLDELRYIDANDTITLHCGDESLTFVVKDIDRNKASIDLKNASKLITGQYKIIVSHKPESERKLAKKPLFVTKSDAFELFEQAMEEYDYDAIEQTLEVYDLEYISESLKRKQTIKSLTRFAKEYSTKVYRPEVLIGVLKYINKYNLYEEIAKTTLNQNKYVYISFINHYLEKNRNMDEHIISFVGSLKDNEDLYSGSIDLLFKAIALRPDNKSLRKKYYKAIRYTNHEGLSIMAGGNLFKQLRKEDKCLIQLDKYKEYSDNTIKKIVEYLTYPIEGLNEKNYPSYLPKIYEKACPIVNDGVKAYQQYIKEHFDLDSIFEDMLIHGIDKKCFEMNCYLYGEEHAAKYVYALDLLTNFKYNLKEKALEKYSSQYENFEGEIEYIYKKKGC